MTTTTNEKPRRRRGKKGKQAKQGKSNSIKENDCNPFLTDKTLKSHLRFTPHSSLLLVLDEDHPYWYDVGKHLSDRNSTTFSNKTKVTTSHVAEHYRTLADQIYHQELTLYQNSFSSDKDERWVENTMKRGTLKDRVAAMSVTSSQAPLHKLKSGLDALLKLATQAKTASQQQRVNQLAGEALVDLFINTYLPPDRKLYSLQNRPLMEYYQNAQKTLSPRILLLWRMEEMIKERYKLFLNLLTKWCSTDTSSQSNQSKQTAMNMTGSTNELQKIMAIKTCAHLLTSRPEHEDLLLQTIVNKLGDPQKKTAAAAGHSLRSILENHPVMIHVMSREVMQLAHRPKLSEKALYHCIIFLNQLQLQHSKSYEKLASELVQTYFRLFQVMVQPPPSSKKNKSSDPKPAMKSRLLSALLTGVNRAHPFLPEQDTLENKERMNSLYKIAHYTTSPGTSTQALLLLYHLVIGISPEKMDSSSEKQDRFYRTLYSTISSPTMVCHGGSKHHLTLYFNLLYKSMKRDSNPLRVLAFAKRLLHTISHAIENACGVLSAALFLLSEVSRSQPIFKTFHVQLQSSSSSTSDNIEFDSMKRDPGLAFGESSSDKYDSSMMYQSSKKIWEVCLLKHHFHPTVKTFATSFMNEERGNAIDYGGDPLRDFALMPFLDRFAYRHPKARKKAGNEEDETEDENKKTMVMMKKHVKANNRLPVNNEQFWKEGRKIGADQEFFQKFFTERARRDAVKGIVRGSTNKVEEEEVLDQAIASNEARTEGNSGLLQKVSHTSFNLFLYMVFQELICFLITIISWKKMAGIQIRKKRHLPMNWPKNLWRVQELEKQILIKRTLIWEDGMICIALMRTIMMLMMMWIFQKWMVFHDWRKTIQKKKKMMTMIWMTNFQMMRKIRIVKILMMKMHSWMRMILTVMSKVKKKLIMKMKTVIWKRRKRSLFPC